MATFKLGAIITDIAGSIGGTTLKRNGNYKVIMNKSSGSSYSRALNNRALSYLGSIFKAWAFLEPDVQALWNTQALSFTFPDKFGNLRNLTGRQLYIKLSSQLYGTGLDAPNPATLTSVIPPFTITDAVWNEGANTLFLNMPSEDGGQYFLFQLEYSLQPLRSPSFVARKVFTVKHFSLTDVYSVLSAIFADYPFINTKYKLRLYVTAINTSGFKSVTQAIDVVIIPAG
jgi:hypothetical protein